MLRRATSLSPRQPSAVVALTGLVLERDRPAAALQFAESAALAAPMERRLWATAAEMALVAGHSSWAVALGLIGLAQAFDHPAAHQQMVAWHSANDDPVGAAFRSATAARIRKRLAL